MKSPMQVAHEMYPEATHTQNALRTIVAAAIEVDRAQRCEIYIVQNDLGEVVDVFRDADEATAAYQGETYSVIEETVWEPGEYAAALRKRCDECEEEATEFWPKLTPPVQLCDSCYHDARRSGWEPGR